jgi:hypothetical protein
MMKKILFLLFFVFNINVSGQEKHHRAKIIYNSIENLEKLDKLGIAIDHGIHKKGYFIISDFSETEIQLAKSIGLNVEIEIEDVSAHYANQNKNSQTFSPEITSCSNSVTDYITPFNFSNGSMGGYLTYPEMLQHLDNMHTLYPNLITARDNVGTYITQEGRQLQWVKITNNPSVPNTKPQVLYTAIHHAREPISLSETIFYMWYLLENYETNEEVKNIVDNTEMYFIPVVNPDGYIYNYTTNPNGGGMWRKNRHVHGNGTFGTDNNRNYDYWINGEATQSVWNTAGISASSSGDTYPGVTPFSEPENQAIEYFVNSHNFKVALNAHSHSNLILYPFGYALNTPSSDNLIFQKLSSAMVSENGFINQIASELYAASGNSDDWMYGQTFNHTKIFAFTPEIGSSFWPASTDIIPLCKKMMLTNITAAKFVLDNTNLVDTAPRHTGNTALATATFELTKLGLSENGNYTVSLNPISTNIATVGAPFTVSNMENLDVVNGTIEYTLANGTTSGDTIQYELVVDNGTYTDKKIITKKFGALQAILNDDCSSTATNFTGNTWAITSLAYVSPTTSITDSPNGNYNNNQTKILFLTNPINLTSETGATISFAAKWDLENNFDYVQFQVSTDNGATWNSQCGKYTNEGSASQAIGQLYDGTQLEWVNEEIDLSDYIGQTIKARFRIKSDAFQTYDGFYFDDFKVNTLENTTLSLTNQVQASQFGIYPNPVNSVLRINTNNEDYSIEIYNTQSQLVFKKENNVGSNEITISDLASGVYFIKLKADGINEVKKVVKK